MPHVDFEATINHVPLTIFEALATSLGEPVTVYLNSVTAPIQVCPEVEPPCPSPTPPEPPCPMPPMPPLPPMPPCPPVEPAPPEPCPPWPPCPWPSTKGASPCPPDGHHMKCCLTSVVSGILTQVGADFLSLAVPIGSPEPAEVLIPYPSVGAVVRGTAVCPEPLPGNVKRGGRMSVG
jgi:hypothetical protein